MNLPVWAYQCKTSPTLSPIIQSDTRKMTCHGRKTIQTSNFGSLEDGTHGQISMLITLNYCLLNINFSSKEMTPSRDVSPSRVIQQRPAKSQRRHPT